MRPVPRSYNRCIYPCIWPLYLAKIGLLLLDTPIEKKRKNRSPNRVLFFSVFAVLFCSRWCQNVSLTTHNHTSKNVELKNTTYDVFMSPAVSTYESPESMHNMRPSAVDTRNTSAKNTAARYTDRYSDYKTWERALDGAYHSLVLA